MPRNRLGLAVGTELAETDTLLFDGRLEIGGRLIRVDIEPDQLGRNVIPEVAILSDAALALRALTDELLDLNMFELDPCNLHLGEAQIVGERLRELIGPDQALAYAGRPESASPATGSMRIHKREQAQLLADAFDGLNA